MYVVYLCMYCYLLQASEMAYACNERPRYRQQQDGYGGPAEDAVVRLRGLPFNAGKEEIAEFFHGEQIMAEQIPRSSL